MRLLCKKCAVGSHLSRTNATVITMDAKTLGYLISLYLIIRYYCIPSLLQPYCLLCRNCKPCSFLRPSYWEEFPFYSCITLIPSLTAPKQLFSMNSLWKSWIFSMTHRRLEKKGGTTSGPLFFQNASVSSLIYCGQDNILTHWALGCDFCFELATLHVLLLRVFWAWFNGPIRESLS